MKDRVPLKNIKLQAKIFYRINIKISFIAESHVFQANYRESGLKIPALIRRFDFMDARGMS